MHPIHHSLRSRRLLGVCAAALLFPLLFSSCGPTYFTRYFYLKSLRPSNRTRIVRDGPAPSMAVAVGLLGPASRDFDCRDEENDTAWQVCDSAGCREVLYEQIDPNVYWTPQLIKGFIAYEFALARWLAAFGDFQATIQNGDAYVGGAAGLSYQVKGTHLGLRIDNAFKLSAFNYDVLRQSESGSLVDARAKGWRAAPGYACDVVANSMKDFLFLRYYLGAGYEINTYKVPEFTPEDYSVFEMFDPDEAEVTVRYRQYHFKGGLYKNIGSWTVGAGGRLVVMLGGISYLKRYPEAELQVVKNIEMPEAVKRRQELRNRYTHHRARKDSLRALRQAARDAKWLALEPGVRKRKTISRIAFGTSTLALAAASAAMHIRATGAQGAADDYLEMRDGAVDDVSRRQYDNLYQEEKDIVQSRRAAGFICSGLGVATAAGFVLTFRF